MNRLPTDCELADSVEQLWSQGQIGVTGVSQFRIGERTVHDEVISFIFINHYCGEGGGAYQQ